MKMADVIAWLNFCTAKFLRHKILTLSKSLVRDNDTIFAALQILKNTKISELSREDLMRLSKNVRKAGLSGVQTYVAPLFALGIFLENHVLQVGEIDFQDLDDEILSDFLTLKGPDLSKITLKNYRIALLNFFNFINKNLQKLGLSHAFNVELNISHIKQSAPKLPAFLKEDEISRFLWAVRMMPMSEKIAARNRVMIIIIIYTGMRVFEAINLKISDIWRENHDGTDMFLLQITGKRAKNRIVMIKAWHIQDLLREWLKIRENLSKTPENLLFCNQKGAPLSQAYIYQIVENLLLFANIRKPKMGAHMLRHSFATLLYARHKDLVLVQEALGHADLNTSKIYTHFDKDELKKAAQIMDGL